MQMPVLKGAEAECKALKDEVKRRGLLEATGDNFAISVADADLRPARCRGRQKVPRRLLAQVRGSHGLDRDPHQGGPAARASCLTFFRTSHASPTAERRGSPATIHIRERSCPKQNRNPSRPTECPYPATAKPSPHLERALEHDAQKLQRASHPGSCLPRISHSAPLSSSTASRPATGRFVNQGKRLRAASEDRRVCRYRPARSGTAARRKCTSSRTLRVNGAGGSLKRRRATATSPVPAPKKLLSGGLKTSVGCTTPVGG